MNQWCKRCIYDARIPSITFDSLGICSYCHQYDEMDQQFPAGKAGTYKLEKIVQEIKEAGRESKYDVVVGVSGGCDSSYTLHLAKQWGLRPLAVHFDNTWNSQVAVENIQAMLSALDVDLYTYVVDSREYNDILTSFLKASVPEIDTPTDLALATTHFMAAKQHGIKYIFHGHSFRTEGISPPGWFYMDARYVSGIHRQFGTRPMKTLPNLWMSNWFRWMLIDGIKQIRPLYYVDYVKQDVKKFLSQQYGWQWYGGHHMENRTSYFTNNYYLPQKFDIDLRYTEFSALVRSGQMSRENALREIQKEKPVDQQILSEVKTRLQLSDSEFEDIMALPPRSYRDYPTYKKWFERMRPIFWVLAQMNLVPESFYRKYTVKEKS